MQAASGPELMLLRRVCGGKEGSRGERWRGGGRGQGGMARLLCDPHPHPESSGGLSSGPRGSLPTPPETLVGGLAHALRTVLLGPGGEVPGPGSSHPRGSSPPRHLEGSWRKWPISGPTETLGGRTPELASFNNLESLSVGELQSKSKGPGLDHQPWAQETVFPSTHTA